MGSKQDLQHLLDEWNISAANNTRKMSTPIVLVHGGAGNIGDDAVPGKISGVIKAVEKGYVILSNGGNAVDAAQACVEVMEEDEAFNAGRGSVLNLAGEVEMDAIIMDGTNLKVGSVGAIKHVLHPIAVARLVMDKSPHAFLVGEGANRFAEKHGVKTVPAYRLVTPAMIAALERYLHSGSNAKPTSTELEAGVGTVGAVVIDKNGKIAVATSTGGTLGKYPGRIGDTPQPGSGGYSDDKIGGVSTTGNGESIMRVCLAHRIINLMEQGKSPRQANEEALKYMGLTVGETAGAITISRAGEIGIYFISKRMAWAYKKGEEPIVYGIDSPDP